MCFCRAHYLLLAVIVVLGLASMLGACGAKGDLYLPERPRTQQEAPAPAASTGTTERPAQQPQQQP